MQISNERTDNSAENVEDMKHLWYPLNPKYPCCTQNKLDTFNISTIHTI